MKLWRVCSSSVPVLRESPALQQQHAVSLHHSPPAQRRSTSASAPHVSLGTFQTHFAVYTGHVSIISLFTCLLCSLVRSLQLELICQSAPCALITPGNDPTLSHFKRIQKLFFFFFFFLKIISSSATDKGAATDSRRSAIDMSSFGLPRSTFL